MRWPWLLVLAACSDPPEEKQAREACDALLVCASIVNPFTLRDFEAAYGEEGVCWEKSEDTTLCADACVEGLTGLWIQYDHHEGCDPFAFIEPGKLTVEQFFDLYSDQYCAAVEACDPDRTCYGYSYGNGNVENCQDYDALAADLCISTEWTCDENYYTSYPVPPTVCADVCD